MTKARKPEDLDDSQLNEASAAGGQGKTIIGGFKSMSGMSSETEIVEAVKQNASGDLAAKRR